MTVRFAAHSDTDLVDITLLLQRARYLFNAGGHEDIAQMVRAGTVSVGYEHDQMWGMAGMQLEARPATLPDAAPDRAYIRHVALDRGCAPSVQGAELMAHLLTALDGHVRPVEVTAYCNENWLRAPLLDLGFSEAERVQFMRLLNLQQRTLPRLPDRPDIAITPLELGALDALSRLDAAAFPPRWHFSESELLPLIMAGHVRGAFHDGVLVGYSALSIDTESGALLERIAVAPDHRRHGIGHLLLLEAVHRARSSGAPFVTLNTQNHNQEAHALYTDAGFRWTGYNVPILIKVLAPVA